jgi:EAL domain-containing protein (putative c-di-GMP-specific phosphodiesterase class I)/signal transduction histidine kinase/CheY-like chemotaxis protein
VFGAAGNRRGRSIAGKLQALVLAAVVAATVTVGGLSLWTELGRYADAKRESLLSTAQVFASVVSRPAVDGDRAAINRTLRAVAQMPDIAYARVEDARGALLAEIGAGLRLQSDLRISGGGDKSGIGRLLSTSTIEVVAPVRQDGRVVGKFTLVARATDLRERVQSILYRSLLACVIALAIGLIIAARLQHSITAPIGELDAAVARIRSSQSFDAPVTAKSDDEVGRLVDGFNAMLGEIRARDARIEAQVKGLEREVDARTTDLRVARDAAEHANRAKSDFLAAMSHEIRTPMNGMLVMAELLASGELSEKPRRYADVIVRSGKSLLTIINDLLDFSKIEAGKLDLESARVDLVEVMDQIAALFWERARGKGLDFAVHLAPDVPRFVTGDSVRIGQIVSNLVTNALKFTEDGYVLVTVTRDPRREGALRFAVRDTGIGIPKDKIAAIFAAFGQVDQSTTRKYGGTGLGLTICRRLARAMGGDIGVKSEPGRGSTFAASLVLPAVAEERAAWLALTDARTAVIDSALPVTRRVLAQYLRAAGYEVAPEEASAGCAANLVFADPDRMGAHAKRDAGTQRVVLRALGDQAADEALAARRAEAALDLPLLRADLEALLEDAAAGTLQQRRKRAAQIATVARYAGRRVLVADDNAVNREVAVESLSRFAVVADVAENGREALEMAEARAYDLILMDGSMPEMDGFAATAALRAHEAETGAARTPVIALTADVLGASAEAWTDAGADGVLHKPFTMAALGAHLAAHFGEPDSVGDEAPAADGADVAVEEAADLFANLDDLGAPDFVRRVVGLYLDQAPKRLAEMAAAVGAGDQDAAARAAHAIKSMSLSLGAQDVAEASARAERRVRIEGGDLADTDVAAVGRALERAVRALADRKARTTSAPAAGDARAARRAELEAAIRNDELELHYQPIVDRGGQKVIGFEGLVRWRMPDGALREPQEFVRCAEECGLIVLLGDWVIDRAARDAAGWGEVFVSVNASPTQLRDPQFDARLLATLARHGLDPKRFVLEITEQATLQAEDAVIELIRRLRTADVQIALDDFGTGFSSLTHLRRTPVDKLKIDKSFVTDLGAGIEGATIIHAVVSIGRTLGFQMVAEGVETPEQHAFLRAAGVHAMQGYLFGRAMPVADAAALVALQTASAA